MIRQRRRSRSRKRCLEARYMLALSTEARKSSRKRHTVVAHSVVGLVNQVGPVGDASSGPSRDTRGSVVGGDGVVDVNLDTGFVASVLAGDAGDGAGGARAGASDAQLCAANVVLGALEFLGGVQGNVLSAQQVVARGEVGGQVDSEVLDAAGAGDVGGPLETGRGDLVGGKLIDLFLFVSIVIWLVPRSMIKLTLNQSPEPSYASAVVPSGALLIQTDRGPGWEMETSTVKPTLSPAATVYVEVWARVEATVLIFC